MNIFLGQENCLTFFQNLKSGYWKVYFANNTDKIMNATLLCKKIYMLNEYKH